MNSIMVSRKRSCVTFLCSRPSPCTGTRGSLSPLTELVGWFAFSYWGNLTCFLSRNLIGIYSRNPTRCWSRKLSGAHMKAKLSQEKTIPRSTDQLLTSEDTSQSPSLPTDSPTECWCRFLTQLVSQTHFPSILIPTVLSKKDWLTMTKCAFARTTSHSDQATLSEICSWRDRFTRRALHSVILEEVIQILPRRRQRWTSTSVLCFPP